MTVPRNRATPGASDAAPEIRDPRFRELDKLIAQGKGDAAPRRPMEGAAE